MDMLVGEIRVCRPLYLISCNNQNLHQTLTLHYILCGPHFNHAALTHAKDPPKQAKHLKRVIGNAQPLLYLRSKLSIKASYPATIIQTSHFQLGTLQSTTLLYLSPSNQPGPPFTMHITLALHSSTTFYIYTTTLT